MIIADMTHILEFFTNSFFGKGIDTKMCYTVQKMHIFPADLVTFTEQILNGKLHFLCSVSCTLCSVDIA